MTRNWHWALVVATLLAAPVIGGCGGGDKSDTTPAVTPATTPAASATAAGHDKPKKHKKKPVPKAPATAQTATPATTAGGSATPDRSPKLVKIKVTVTAGSITVSPSPLPAGKGLLFRVTGHGVGDKQVLSATSKGQVVGYARVKPARVLLQTRSIDAGTLELKVGDRVKKVPVR